MEGPGTAERAVERVVREEWGHVLATLVGYVRDIGVAEDVLQDALVAALEHWPREGLPHHPRAWLLQTARRKAIDLYRRDARFAVKRDQLARLVESQRQADEEPGGEEHAVDQRLALIFTCCHPALAQPARVALTLRTLGGLTTTAIARAFLLPETTLAQRLVRAKGKIKAANIPYRVPPPELWPERLDSVLAVVYLIFNEGYVATTSRELLRADLCDEAIRLGRILAGLAPREPEALGLLALMLLHDSRRAARTDGAGRLIALEEQDRSTWDSERIAEGEARLRQALALRHAGPYQLQAAISAVHATAPSFAETDWAQIVGLYGRLFELQPSPVVRLNAAVARSYVEGPGAGLRELSELEREAVLERYQPFHAARADLLRRAGRPQEAAAAYRQAIELSANRAEQRFLGERLVAIESTPPADV